MKQVLFKQGQAVVEEVPTPMVGDRRILVRVCASFISVGTEISGIRHSGTPLYKLALQQPKNVKLALDMAREQGIRQTYDTIRSMRQAGQPSGYSAAGVVIALGAEVTGFAVGDRVACAGAGIANHAEVIDVPVNLAVPLPTDVPMEDAASVTLGAIALQGLRRAAPTLGETFVVMGLGILGQLTVQMLRVNGCRVIGLDLHEARLEMARQGGADAVLHGGDAHVVGRVRDLAGGFGADGVIITASSASHELVSQAMGMCRKKGRVVLVGDVGLNLNRADFYVKELDFLISTSYGPGRYDPVYEEGGRDYPLPYVRWTENRNMEAYLELLATGRVRLDGLGLVRYPLDRAGEAFAALGSVAEGTTPPLSAILIYPEREGAPLRRVDLQPRVRGITKAVRIAVIGAGQFTTAMHLPNLLKLRKEFSLHCFIQRTGHKAKFLADRYQARYAGTDYQEALADPEVDLVLIGSRHHLHGSMVLDALRAGKHVFVEKPLVTQWAELAAIEAFFRQAGGDAPLLLTGYNRRFSPPMAHIRTLLDGLSGPMMINYRMNAGFIPPDHWTQTEEGCGRNIGEACHVYDLFGFLTRAPLERVQAVAIRPGSTPWLMNDNFQVMAQYADGSVAHLTYTAMGHGDHPKERMEIYVDHCVLAMDNYLAVSVAGGRGGWQSSSVQKGHLEELLALAATLRNGGPWPIALDEQLQSARMALLVEDQLQGRPPATLAD